MDARELLRQAADDIERYGWTQGGWVPNHLLSETNSPLRQDCPSCAGGALALAASRRMVYSPFHVGADRPALEEAIRLLAQFLDLDDPDRLGYDALDLVVNWNDEPQRTQAEVVAALRGAAG